jgi:hypothetical protein
VLKARLHMTPVALGRWGGEKASETRARELSKKQKKRKKNEIVLKNGKVDKGKEKLKSNFVNDQINSPDFQKLMTEPNPE